MQVFISERAEKNLDDLMLYLELEWSKSVKEKFKKKLIRSIRIISTFPGLFPSSNLKKGVRKCLITKQVVLYYKITKDSIEIITIQDSRRNPKTIKL